MYSFTVLLFKIVILFYISVITFSVCINSAGDC